MRQHVRRVDVATKTGERFLFMFIIFVNVFNVSKTFF